MSVTLVGAGCGSPRLLTIAAADCIAAAQHIIYDRLIHPDILQLAPDTCRFYPVGKRERYHSMSQSGINELLVELGRTGEAVVRLKGGDPFVFGRGGEEACALSSAGVLWRAIPGITSALGGALSCGIPVTHRESTSSVMLATGHRRCGPLPDDDAFWRQIALATGTVALYMGTSAFAEIDDRLVSLGKDPESPVSVISWGGWGRAARTDGTLSEICALARRGALVSPAVIYLGETAKAGLCGSPQTAPLCGMQIVVCRPYPECWRTGRALEELGADCYGLPLLRMESLEPEDLAAARDAVESADWLVLTSPRGPGELIRIAGDLRKIGGRIVALGEGTAEALRSIGIPPECTADGSSEGLAVLLGRVVCAGESVVFARNERSSHVALKAARAAGAVVKSLATYRMVERDVPGIEIMREQWASCGVDAVVFGSSALVETYSRAIGAPPEGAELIAWGSVCAKTIEEVFGRPARRLCTPDISGLVETLSAVRR